MNSSSSSYSSVVAKVFLISNRHESVYCIYNLGALMYDLQAHHSDSIIGEKKSSIYVNQFPCSSSNPNSWFVHPSSVTPFPGISYCREVIPSEMRTFPTVRCALFIVSISSSVSVTSRMFSSIRAGVPLLGITTMPRCTAHDSDTTAGEQLWFLAMLTKSGCVRIWGAWRPPRVL